MTRIYFPFRLVLVARQENSKTRYMNDIFGKEDSLLKSLRIQAEKEQVSGMQIHAYEARILQFLVKAFQVKKLVEVGTLYAYSTLHLARALPEEGRIWTCDRDINRHKKAQEILKLSPEYKKIHWLTGLALESLQNIEDQGPFDMMFIDADKQTYGQYLNWAEKNLKKGSILVADNTFLFGSVYGETSRSSSEKAKDVMQKLNKRLSSSALWEGIIIPSQEGLTCSVKK